MSKHVTNPVFSIILSMLFPLIAFSQKEKKVDFSRLSEQLQTQYAGQFEFSARVEKNGEVMYTEHSGYTDSENGKPINENTLFNIASITKSITAVGILKLVEAKKIGLSDSLGEIFENVPESKRFITVQTLLSHKSGLRQTYPLAGIKDSEEALKVIMKQELEFTPTSGFRYSNQNFQLLALIIEKITGMPFEDFIRNEVLKPLEMKHTYFWDEVDRSQNIAPLPNNIKRRIGKRNWGFTGAVGLFSTTSDLSKFWNGIYKSGFLTETSLDMIFQPQYETSSGIQVGLGFFKTPVTKWNMPELWTRGTESWGHNSAVSYFPERDITIIVSTNSGEIDNDPRKTGNRLISELIANYLFD